MCCGGLCCRPLLLQPQERPPAQHTRRARPDHPFDLLNLVLPCAQRPGPGCPHTNNSACSAVTHTCYSLCQSLARVRACQHAQRSRELLTSRRVCAAHQHQWQQRGRGQQPGQVPAWELHMRLKAALRWGMQDMPHGYNREAGLPVQQGADHLRSKKPRRCPGSLHRRLHLWKAAPLVRALAWQAVHSDPVTWQQVTLPEAVVALRHRGPTRHHD